MPAPLPLRHPPLEGFQHCLTPYFIGLQCVSMPDRQAGPRIDSRTPIKRAHASRRHTAATMTIGNTSQRYPPRSRRTAARVARRPSVPVPSALHRPRRSRQRALDRRADRSLGACLLELHGLLRGHRRLLSPIRGRVTVAVTRGKVVFHDPRRDLLDQRSDCLHQTQRSRASAFTNQHHRSICSRPTMALSQPGASHAAATGDTAALRCIGATGTLGRRSGARLFNNAGLTRSLSAPLN